MNIHQLSLLLNYCYFPHGKLMPTNQSQKYFIAGFFICDLYGRLEHELRGQTFLDKYVSAKYTSLPVCRLELCFSITTSAESRISLYILVCSFRPWPLTSVYSDMLLTILNNLPKNVYLFPVRPSNYSPWEKWPFYSVLSIFGKLHGTRKLVYVSYHW